MTAKFDAIKPGPARATPAGWGLVLSAFLFAGCSTTSRNEGVHEAPGVSSTLLKALARLGYLDSGCMTNTFFIPTQPTGEAGDTCVIYWKEQNVLFFYAAEPRPEVADFPRLVRGHQYEVREGTFVRPGDPGASTSTYLTSPEWAFERLIDATVNGRRFVLVHNPGPSSLK